MNDLNNLIIDIYVLCWNEEQIIPYVIDYWKYINPRKVYVYDNESTDDSRKLLLEYDKVEIIEYESDNNIRDDIYTDIKNNCWKESDADFVIVCDMDECVYSDHLHEILQYMKDNNQTISHTAVLTTVSKYIQPHDVNTLYHEYNDTNIWSFYNVNDKALIFSPTKIQEIEYISGAHDCSPAGVVNWYDKQNIDPIFTIHIKNLSLNYKLTRHGQYYKRLSDFNKENGLGYHYMFQNEQQITDFLEVIQDSKKYDDIIKEIYKL